MKKRYKKIGKILVVTLATASVITVNPFGLKTGVTAYAWNPYQVINGNKYKCDNIQVPIDTNETDENETDENKTDEKKTDEKKTDEKKTDEKKTDDKKTEVKEPEEKEPDNNEYLAPFNFEPYVPPVTDTIEEEATPLAEAEDEQDPIILEDEEPVIIEDTDEPEAPVEIKEEKTPLASMPKTGDVSSVAFAAELAAAMALVLKKTKKK